MAAIVLITACERVPADHTHLVVRTPPPSPVPQPHFRPECTALAARRVGDGIDPPVLIRRVNPKKVAGVQGIVIIETIIDADGNICDAAVLKGINAEVDADALAAVKQWQFKPAYVKGHPVAVTFDLTVTYPPRAS